MSHIFISYSRKDIDYVRKIVTALEASEFDVWIDLDDIPKGEDWEQEIYRNINEAEAFLFMLSPDSVISEMCNKEIAHAVENGKRILPIVIRDADVEKFLFKNSREEISKRNWIFCRQSQDNFLKTIEEVSETIHADYEWLRYHTQLQLKALDWERRKRNPDSLIYGDMLDEAQQWIGNPKTVDPDPTLLMLTYLQSSQQESQQRKEKARRRILQSAGIGSGIIILLVCVFLWLLGGGWGQYFTKTAPLNYKEVDDVALQKAQGGISANRDWTPAIREFNGVKMSLVPAGCFMMGSSTVEIVSILALCEKEFYRIDGDSLGTCDLNWFDDVKDQIKICFDKPFWIDVYEVTNAQFNRLIGSAAIKNRKNDNRPRENITWFEAAKFCQDRGGRLPTEAEWEYAARGPDGLIYPWGNEFNSNNLSYGSTGFFSSLQSSMVGNFPNGASWVGALDMSGNLWEWTNSIYARYPYNPNDGREVDGQHDDRSNRVSRGGCFMDNGVNMGGANRLEIGPTARIPTQGFRCAMNFHSIP